VARLLCIGLALGMVASLWASSFVRTLLFGLEPHDPATLTSAAIVVSVVSVLAAWLPARVAARIDPATVLREG
jgi:ABC-type antimicrobial peptide transport system permease subunit